MTTMVETKKNIETEKSKAAELVAAAFQEIAQKGFAGLRTRDVAAQVGITQATLHYYFSTKQQLIEAVVAHAVAQIDAVRTLQGKPAPQDAAAELQQHFADILQQLQHNPAVFVVLDEIALHARRDNTVAAVIGASDQGWKRYLSDLLRRGIVQGHFQPMADVEGCAELIVGFFKGTVLQVPADSVATRKAVAQLATWILKG